MPRKKPITSKISDEEIRKSVARGQTSIQNPELQEFDDLVDTILQEVRNKIDELKANHDTSPESIKHFTHDVIQKHLRNSKWA